MEIEEKKMGGISKDSTNEVCLALCAALNFYLPLHVSLGGYLGGVWRMEDLQQYKRVSRGSLVHSILQTLEFSIQVLKHKSCVKQA